jgi:hypothetical protein
MFSTRPIAATVLAAAACVSTLAAARPPQMELDRIVSRVHDRIVTQSDVRQARLLTLVEAATSDEAAQHAIETRLLILHELERAAPLSPPEASALETRRREWFDVVGGPARAADLLRSRAMTQADVDGWLRDDLRISAYLNRQFGMLVEADRSRAMNEWLTRLRQRADLTR